MHLFALEMITVTKILRFTAIHSIATCRMRRFLAVLSSSFHSSPLRTFSCHPSPPTILPSSVTSSCHLFPGIPLSLVPEFIYNTFLGILFPSIFYACPNQRNLFNLTVSITVGFFNTCINFFIGKYPPVFFFIGPRIFLYTFLSKMYIHFHDSN